MAGKESENTWNSRLSGALRKRGFANADFERIFQTSKGQRKPDVSFETEKGLFIVSAKLGSKKEVDALSTAQEYQQDLKDSENLIETFATTYPSENERNIFHIRVLATQKHGSFSWVFNNLEGLADKISEISEALYEKAALNAEHPAEASIRVLRKGVMELILAFRNKDMDEFKSLFGGSSLFESILGYEEGKIDEERVLKSAASYLFMNQVLFYEILSKERKEFEKIKDKDLDNPVALKTQYFDKVLQIDYAAVFSFDIASKIKDSAAKFACKKIILSIRALFPGKVNHDVIGKVFHNLIPLELRKTVAAYFTSSGAADLL